MIKLKKVNSTSWNGNGFGSSPAEWVVKNAEHILVAKRGMDWYAIDTRNNTRVAKGWTKKMLLENLAEIA